MTSVFLSYARGDDGEPFDPSSSFVAKLHRDLTARGFDVWFDRVSLPSRGPTFHQEIRDAIAQRDRVLLVVGPQAVASEYVRQEWEFAYFEAEKVVTPILRLNGKSADGHIIDGYSLIPDELKLLHCEDFRDKEDFRDEAQYAFHLEQLVRILNEPVPPLGKLIGVPSLPPHYLSRADRLIPLRDAVRSGLDSPAPLGGETARHQFYGISGTTPHVGMHGMGGIGKSVLANLLAHDRKIREAFPDGILWVGLGSLPNLANLMRDAHRGLGGDGAFETEHEGKTKLKGLLADKAVLLVLDDAWRRPDVDAFDVLGPRCRALITTRDAGLLTKLGGTHHVVELLTDAEALRLLAVAADIALESLPPEAKEIVRECGRLPLAVALCGGLVRRRSWSEVLDQLRQARIDRIADRHAIEPQHENVWRAIHVSVAALEPAEKARFLELAVFPSDETIPEPALATYWQHTGAFDEWDTGELLTSFAERSLVQLAKSRADADQATRGFMLHDLIYDYLRNPQTLRESQTSVRDQHETLLAAYQAKCPDGWWKQKDDGYFLTHLRGHLAAAGRIEELANLLQDLRWLEAKNSAGLAFDLPHDFSEAIVALPEEDDRRRIFFLLDEALRRELHFIDRHRDDYPQGLFQCLWNNAWWYDSAHASNWYDPPNDGWSTEGPPWERIGRKLSSLLESWRTAIESTQPGVRWLRSMRPPAIHLGTSQKAMFDNDFNERRETATFFSDDGRVLISGKNAWDVKTGAKVDIPLEIIRKKATSKAVAGAAGDEATKPKTPLEIMREKAAAKAAGAAGEETAKPKTPLEIIREMAAAKAAGAAGEETVKPKTPLEIIREMAAAKAANESGESAKPKTPMEPRSRPTVRSGTAGETTAPKPESFPGLRYTEPDYRGSSYDGRFHVYYYDEPEEPDDINDGNIWVWEPKRNSIQVLRGHRDWLICTAFSPDGKLLASTGSDRTTRIWDLCIGDKLARIHGHVDLVRWVTFSDDGQRLVSVSVNGTIWSWDGLTGLEVECIRFSQSRVIEGSAPFSFNGRYLVFDENHVFHIRDVSNSAEIASFPNRDGWTGFAIDQTGTKLLATGPGDVDIYVLHLATGTPQHILNCEKQRSRPQFASSSDGQFVAVSSKSVEIFDLQTEHAIAQFAGLDTCRGAIAFSPNGRQFLAGNSGTVFVWNIASGTVASRLRLYDLWGDGEAQSPDGRWLARSTDQGAIIIDSKTGMESVRLPGRIGTFRSLAFSSDGRCLLTRTSRSVRVWAVPAGNELGCLTLERDGSVSSQHGLPIVEITSEGMVRVVDVTNGSEVACLPIDVPESELVAACFSADGNRVVCEWSHGEIQVWDMHRSSCIQTHRAISDVKAIATGHHYLAFGNPALAEVIIIDNETNKPVAWIHCNLRAYDIISAHPCGGIWAAASGNQLFHFTLEGEVRTD